MKNYALSDLILFNHQYNAWFLLLLSVLKYSECSDMSANTFTCQYNYNKYVHDKYITKIVHKRTFILHFETC